MDREARQMRTTAAAFKTRAAEDGLYIEGYFAVFNTNYEMWTGASESIAPGAFRDTLGNDIRALTNHDTSKVLGRNKVGTLELREDDHGLWGRITINPNDGEAVNLYERVKRGDVDQCSFGFNILDEETEYLGEEVHWTIKKVDLYEVSVCTFPAYEETSVKAREKDFEALKERRSEANKLWQQKMLSTLRRTENA